jgi:hypothetical protein
VRIPTIRRTLVHGVNANGVLYSNYRLKVHVYAANLDYRLVDERYRDDRTRGALRVLKEANLDLPEDRAVELAGEERSKLLARDQ